MNICIIGTGYVGLVTGACLAELGHTVWCVDIDKEKISQLQSAVMPIYEEGLKELVTKHSGSRIVFTSDLTQGLADAEIVMSAVGTPSDGSGQVDLQYIQAVAKEVGAALGHKILFVNKSTVPVGTAELVTAIIKDNLVTPVEFEVASNPEFLREGVAIKDFLHPDRVVIGVASEWSQQVLTELYQPLLDNGTQLYVTDIRSAELIKYASNCFLALKISYINEIANLCEKVGADVLSVSQGMGMDKRIGPHFLQAGPGYGGSCFPKDVNGLIHTAHENGIDLNLLEAVVDVNNRQRLMPLHKLIQALGSLHGKKIAIWGLSFKPNSDDVRESSSITVVQALLDEGAVVCVYDPMAMPNFKRLFSTEVLSYAPSKEEALHDADALILMTHWDEFVQTPANGIAQNLSGRVVIDTRNSWSRHQMEMYGLTYTGVGR